MISDNKALYLQDMLISEYPANTQRIIRSSIEYFCRWADAVLAKNDILTDEYLESSLSRYHSHLISLKLGQGNLRTKLKYAKLFVRWLQSTLPVQANSPKVSLLNLHRVNNDVFWTSKRIYYAMILLFISLLLYILYLIAPNLLRGASSRDTYYAISSSKSIRIQLNPTSPVLSLNSLEGSTFEFKFIGGKKSAGQLIVYCPVSYLSMEPKVNIISVPLSSCSSKNIDASTELIDFQGYVDIYIDKQFIARKVLS